jgi:hypothetical protein
MAEINRRLKDYIESDAKRLPLDFKEFQIGAAQSEYCVFCRSVAEDLLNTIWSRDPKTGQLSEEHCISCDSCFSHIEESFQTKNIRAGMSPSALNRIEEFAKFNTFYEDHMYYRPKGTVSLSDRPSSKRYCYFCQKETYDFGTTFEAPVVESKSRTGGPMTTCDTCSTFIVTSKLKLDFGANHHCKCDRCQKTYVISDEEQRHRESTRIKYNCPTCVDKTLKEVRKTSSLYHEKYRTEEYSRFTDLLKCKTCATAMIYDLYVDFDALHTSCPDATKIECAKCRTRLDALTGAVLAHELIVSLANHQVCFKKDVLDTQLWGYEITRASGSVLVIVRFSYENLDSAMHYATEEIIKDARTTQTKTE